MKKNPVGYQNCEVCNIADYPVVAQQKEELFHCTICNGFGYITTQNKMRIENESHNSV